MPRTAEPEQVATTSRNALVRGGATIGRRALQQLGENPLQAFFGAAIVALLIFNFTGTNIRIDDTNDRIDDTNNRIDDTNNRIARLEMRMGARFAALEDRVTRLEERMDARFTALEEDVAEINLKLTALIAALNQTDEVTAALEGRLIDRTPDAGPTDATPG